MKLYIDEDMSDTLLMRLLKKAGHDLLAPVDLGLLGRSDAVQFTYAIRNGRACLTANYDDYEELHLLLREGHGDHPGVLVVRKDNDPARDLTPKGIVTALRKLETAEAPIANEFIVLNHWR